jgi:hypothetical protein
MVERTAIVPACRAGAQAMCDLETMAGDSIGKR